MKYKYIGLFVFSIFFTQHISVVAAQDVLCPEPSKTAATAPADLAQVQNDIDRLTLCVERAKLLSELDKAIDDRSGSDKKGNSLKAIVPLNPTADELSEIIETETIAVKNIPANEPLSAVEKTSARSKPTAGSSWKIRRIWGEKGNTKAQLVKKNGVIATVVVNDVLPDGYVVTSLTPMGISVKKDGSASDLEWMDAESDEESGNE